MLNFIEYPKINTIFKRNLKTKKIILGDFSCPEFAYLQNNIWEFSEKIDGTNCRIGWDYDTKNVQIGGRTEKAQMPVELYERLQELFPAEKMTHQFPNVSALLFGEGYGRRIQAGGKYKSDGVDYILFDVLIGGWWLRRSDVIAIAAKLGIGSVPMVGEGTLHDAINIVQNGMKSTFGDFEAEGLVLRPQTELFARNRSRIITKIKCKDFMD